MMMPQSKLPEAGTTIFTVMSQLAQQYNAINLGQGFPDFPMPQVLINAVCEAMNEGNNQYAHTNGLLLLREQLSEKINRLYGATINAETEITITPGATYAIYTALTSLLQTGDEVIVFEPAYDSYVPNIIINGAKPVFVALQYPDYSIDWDEVKKKITAKTKAIIINSPHNPTGSVLSDEDMIALTAIAENSNLFIISDEVYEHLVFDGKKHQSILAYPHLLNQSFAIFSFGKTYHCTGWKTGYCVAGEKAMHEFRKVHQFNAFSTCTPVQAGIAKVLADDTLYTSLAAQMQAKRDFFFAALKDTLLKPLQSKGSYFQCYNYSQLSAAPDKEFAIDLVKQYGVATIPVSDFYHNAIDNKTIRFCFAKKENTLAEAALRLQKYKQ